MAATQGNKVNLSDLDALYTRLYNLRNIHANSTHQLNAGAINSAQQSSGLQPGDIVAVSTAKFDLLKQELANLANSKWYEPNTSTNAIVTMADFSNNFSIPNIGDLLEASDFNLIENTITSAESIIPNYSGKYDTRYDARYGTCYSGRYGTCYSSRYGTCYSSRYGTCYSACYSGRYGTCYSGRYGTCYSSRYGTCYSSRYGSCYISRYSSRYSYRTAFTV